MKFSVMVTPELPTSDGGDRMLSNSSHDVIYDSPVMKPTELILRNLWDIMAYRRQYGYGGRKRACRSSGLLWNYGRTLVSKQGTTNHLKIKTRKQDISRSQDMASNSRYVAIDGTHKNYTINTSTNN